MARPRKPIAEHKRNKVQASFTDEEFRLVERAAKGEPLGLWIGERAVEAAKNNAKGRK